MCSLATDETRASRLMELTILCGANRCRTWRESGRRSIKGCKRMCKSTQKLARCPHKPVFRPSLSVCMAAICAQADSKAASKAREAAELRRCDADIVANGAANFALLLSIFRCSSKIDFELCVLVDLPTNHCIEART